LENDTVVQVACGGQHTLLLLADGRLVGMGDNEFGQVGVPAETGEGDETKKTVDLPTHVRSIEAAGQIRQITCGESHSVALTTEGAVYTWGRGQYGQLGHGPSQEGPLFTPTKITSLPKIKKVFSGPNQVFVVEFTNGGETLTRSFDPSLEPLSNHSLFSLPSSDTIKAAVMPEPKKRGPPPRKPAGGAAKKGKK
jgi:alpha-tubulin suppressor-like RCC1 family protein